MYEKNHRFQFSALGELARAGRMVGTVFREQGGDQQGMQCLEQTKKQMASDGQG